MSSSYRVSDIGDPCDDLGAALGLLGGERRAQAAPSPLPAHTAELAATIESSIIPRLLVSHGLSGPQRASAGGEAIAIDAEVIMAFTQELIAQDSRRSEDFVETLLARGVPLDRVLVELMAPAARIMGEFWTADQCSFMDVTLGISRIQQLLRMVQGRLDGSGGGAKGRILLIPAPGEQHTFGLRIVEEFFRRDGWEVRSNLKAMDGEPGRWVAEERFDIVGFSLSAQRLLQPLTLAIADVRRKSLNRKVRIMIGGQLFAASRERSDQLGADVFVTDAREAVLQANEWCQSAQVN